MRESRIVLAALVLCIAFLALFTVMIASNLPAAERFATHLLPLEDALRFMGLPFEHELFWGNWTQEIYQALTALTVMEATLLAVLSGIDCLISNDFLRQPTFIAMEALKKNGLPQYGWRMLGMRLGFFAVWVLGALSYWVAVKGIMPFRINDASVAFAFSCFFAVMPVILGFGSVAQLSWLALDLKTVMHGFQKSSAH